VKVLLIGYGSIGKRHAEILNKIEKIKRIDIVTSQNIKNSYGKCFISMQKIDNFKEYDYFVIANETYKHFDTLKYITQKVSGKKILVEKPLFCKTRKLDISNNIVYVAYNLRFHPIIEEIFNILKNKKAIFANLIAGQYLPTWRPNIDYRQSYSASEQKGGGVLRDLSHEIDYVNFLFSEIKHLYVINKKISNLEISSDDIFTAIGETKSGTIVNITLDYISKTPLRKIVIHTLNKTLKADLIKNYIKIFDKFGKYQTIKKKVKRSDSYLKMHLSFINDKTENLCSFKEGLKVMELIDQVKLKRRLNEK